MVIYIYMYLFFFVVGGERFLYDGGGYFSASKSPVPAGIPFKREGTRGLMVVVGGMQLTQTLVLLLTLMRIVLRIFSRSSVYMCRDTWLYNALCHL